MENDLENFPGNKNLKEKKKNKKRNGLLTRDKRGKGGGSRNKREAEEKKEKKAFWKSFRQEKRERCYGENDLKKTTKLLCLYSFSG